MSENEWKEDYAQGGDDEIYSELNESERTMVKTIVGDLDPTNRNALVTKANRTLEQLSDRVEVMEKMYRAFWALLLEKGYTNEELNAIIALVLNETNKAKESDDKVQCTSCGRLMKKVAPFQVKCMYCGAFATVPYAPAVNIKKEPTAVPTASENPIASEDVLEETIEEEEIIDPAAVASNVENYNLDDDLKFDDIV